MSEIKKVVLAYSGGQMCIRDRYGVTLQHKKVMMSVVASSFIGGLFVGLMKVKAFVAMGPGLAGMAMFVDPDNGKNLSLIHIL